MEKPEVNKVANIEPLNPDEKEITTVNNDNELSKDSINSENADDNNYPEDENKHTIEKSEETELLSDGEIIALKIIRKIDEVLEVLSSILSDERINSSNSTPSMSRISECTESSKEYYMIEYPSSNHSTPSLSDLDFLTEEYNPRNESTEISEEKEITPDSNTTVVGQEQLIGDVNKQEKENLIVAQPHVGERSSSTSDASFIIKNKLPLIGILHEDEKSSVESSSGSEPKYTTEKDIYHCTDERVADAAEILITKDVMEQMLNITNMSEVDKSLKFTDNSTNALLLEMDTDVPKQEMDIDLSNLEQMTSNLLFDETRGTDTTKETTTEVTADIPIQEETLTIPNNPTAYDEQEMKNELREKINKLFTSIDSSSKLLKTYKDVIDVPKDHENRSTVSEISPNPMSVAGLEEEIIEEESVANNRTETKVRPPVAATVVRDTETQIASKEHEQTQEVKNMTIPEYCFKVFPAESDSSSSGPDNLTEFNPIGVETHSNFLFDNNTLPPFDANCDRYLPERVLDKIPDRLNDLEALPEIQELPEIPPMPPLSSPSLTTFSDASDTAVTGNPSRTPICYRWIHRIRKRMSVWRTVKIVVLTTGLIIVVILM